MPLVDGVHIDRFSEFGLIIEKDYTLNFVFQLLQEDENCSNLIKILNPFWGKEIIHFDYNSVPCVILSAQSSPCAAIAVERLKRTGVKRIVGIGTTGSTDESIKPGQFILATAAVRDEGTSKGYLDLLVPATAHLETILELKSEFENFDVIPLLGTVYTTDQRYKEKPDILRFLYCHANVLSIDMETASILITSMYHGISAGVIKIVTDCAVKETSSDFQGIFEVNENYSDWMESRLKIALQVSLKTIKKCQN
ncbi:phosphorylase family protein [Microcoleus sp. CZ3-B4]|uniref:phosphorylase family protein n=1 Tax=Microcoleus sp. CZ3-B4 TaxID=2818733 RepID=UPI002FD31586